MAITAAIRSLIITLTALGLSWLVTTLNLTDQIDVKAVAEVVANGIIVVGSGLVAYTVNKLGSRWPWVNQVMSLWRAKSPAVYIPNDKEEVTATATPPGEVTTVTTTSATGAEAAAKV